MAIGRAHFAPCRVRFRGQAQHNLTDDRQGEERGHLKMSRQSSENSGKRGPKRKGSVQYSFVDWEATQLLLQMQIGMAYAGGAVRVGLTRDGGALAIGIYHGDHYETEYIRPTEDLMVELRLIIQAWGIPLPTWDDEADCWVQS